jgi:hypothetical protein
VLQATVRGTGPFFDAVTAVAAVAPEVAYLKASTQLPSVFHHGNRGLTRDHVLNGYALFLAVAAEVDDPAGNGPKPYRNGSAADLHAHLPRFR